MDETYIKVRGRWMYLYRTIDSVGDTVEFFFSEHRDLPAAASAEIIPSGIEMIHMMRKRQAWFACNPRPSIAEQFKILAA